MTIVAEVIADCSKYWSAVTAGETTSISSCVQLQLIVKSKTVAHFNEPLYSTPIEQCFCSYQ